MKYKDFSVDQFVADDFFQKWVLNSNRESRDFWENWLLINPDKKKTVEKAALIVKSIHFKDYKLKPHEIDEMWSGLLLQTTEKSHLKNNLQKKIRSYQRRYWLKVAASFSLILISTIFLLTRMFDEPRVVVTTNYGEIKTVILPDNSEVVLNANSSLSYQKNFIQDIRKVHLQGEAFFEVTELKDGQGLVRFQVLTDNLKVEVLGTAFNIKNRRSNTQVVLNSGKVNVEINDQDSRQVSMAPGEMVDYFQVDQKLIKRKVKVEPYSAWREEKLILDETSLNEIIQQLEDHFGIRMSLRDPSLGNRKFTGTYQMNDAEILFKSLEAAFNIKFYKTQNGYRIVNREPN